VKTELKELGARLVWDGRQPSKKKDSRIGGQNK
jgi:hypothetical protein